MNLTIEKKNKNWNERNKMIQNLESEDSITIN